MTGEVPRRRERAGPLRSLRFRIVAAFLASILAMVGAQGYLIWQQGVVAGSLALITEGYVPLATIAAKLERDQQRVATDVDRLLRDEQRPGTGARSPATIYTDAFQRSLADGQSVVTRAKELAQTGSERALLNKTRIHLQRIDDMARAYQDSTTEFVRLAEAGRRDEGGPSAEKLKRDGNLLSDEVGQLKRLIDDRMAQLVSQTEQTQVQTTAVAGALAALSVGFSLVLIGIVLYALRPIRLLTAEVQRLAAGDYGGRVDVRGAHEVAVLAAEFNAMVRALQVRDQTLVERANELNRLSRYLGSVVDGLQEALLVVESGRVTLANPAARERWAATVGEPLPAPLGPEVPAPGRHDLVHPDNTLHELRVTPFGEHGALLIADDVTEQTLTRERLARSERLALVGQMLAQIVHEVRNPLNAMSLNAELLADELGTLDAARRTEAWDQLDTIASEIDRLTAVTAHYLQLARRPPATLRAADLRELVDDVVRLLDLELAQQGVALEVHSERLSPQLVDGNQLRQALLNVVRNAVESGARHLVLALARQGMDVVLSLTDDGPGMTPEQIDRATDPFFSTKATGTGLGLAITRQILEDHGGSVRVASTPGRGSVVSLALPWRPADRIDETLSGPH